MLLTELAECMEPKENIVVSCVVDEKRNERGEIEKIYKHFSVPANCLKVSLIPVLQVSARYGEVNVVVSQNHYMGLKRHFCKS